MSEDFIKPSDKRKKRRNKRGNTRVSWEKLRERRVLGIDTLGDGSLASAGIPDGNIAKPSSSPGEAGHTVSGISGGIIPGITNGGLGNPAPSFTKALPRLGRIGRRTLNSAEITGDQNPMTRVDANNNGLLFDGTWREMPDPTPTNAAGSITGAMARERNAAEFVGIDKLLSEHYAQARLFDSWEKSRNWNAFHRNHFDWWMFPIPRGSNTYRDKYNIAGESLDELKTNDKYMSTLRNAIRQYSLSLGWDLENKKWVDNPEIINGQTPRGNINSPRLYKIAQSAEAHQMYDERDSLAEMVNGIRASGIRVGNEDYWDKHGTISGKMSTDKPDEPNKEPEEIKKPLPRLSSGTQAQLDAGFGGSSGVSLRPKKFEPPAGKAAYDDEFKELWAKRDEVNAELAGTDVTFDWRDEESRLDYISKHAKMAFPSKNKKGKPVNYAKFGNISPGMQGSIAPEFLKKTWATISALGLAHGKRGGGYPVISNPYGSLFSHSESPSVAGPAEANIARDLLGYFSEQTNPYQFWTNFEAFIRNPYVTMRDPVDGKQKGIRYVLGNDREKMLKEYRSRISAMQEALSQHFTGMPWQYDEEPSLGMSPKEAVKKLEDDSPRLATTVNLVIGQEISKPHRSMDRMAVEIKTQLQNRTSPSDSQRVSPAMIREMVSVLDAKFETSMTGKNPSFFDEDIFANYDDNELKTINDWADIAVAEELSNAAKEKRAPILSPDSMHGDFVSMTSPDITIEQTTKAINDAVSRSNISGKMSATNEVAEAEYIGYNPDNPESISNHMLSPESSYDVRPKPVQSVQEARDTGAPLEWLMPGNYPTEIEDILNDLTGYVISKGYTSIEDVREMGTGKPEDVSAFKALVGEKAGELQSILSRLGFGGGRDRELTVEEQSIVEALTGVKAKLFSEVPMDGEGSRAAMVKNFIQLNPHANEINQIALGLIQRATTAGFKTNFLSTKSGQGDTATEQTLEQWKKSIQSAISVNAPEFNDVEPHELPIELSVAMPIQATLDMLQSGKFKTLFESGTSRGNSMDNIRRVQEFTLFGYLPSFSGQRPIYGVTAPDGLTESNLDATHHYGPIKLVMHPHVNSRSTWTESDSLSMASTASSFSNPTKHALFSQELKGDLLSFAKSDSDYERFDYTEAQIHGGVALSDVAYIVVDDRFYDDPWRGASEWPAIDEGGQSIEDPDWTKPDNLEDYGPYIQISRIAQSLNIPIVRASEVIDAGEDEVFKP